jgi:hypothetical protein
MGVVMPRGTKNLLHILEELGLKSNTDSSTFRFANLNVKAWLSKVSGLSTVSCWGFAGGAVGGLERGEEAQRRGIPKYKSKTTYHEEPRIKCRVDGQKTAHSLKQAAESDLGAGY